jgi:hypothetical protein
MRRGKAGVGGVDVEKLRDICSVLSDETVEKGFITLQQVENEVISNFHDVPAPTWLSRLVFSLALKV